MEKEERLLRDILVELGSVLVAFSGGVDSTFLLSVAHQVLGDRVLAVTAASPLHPRRELSLSRELARQLGVRQHIVRTREFKDHRFLQNDPQRCYYCKRGLFEMLLRIARQEGLDAVVEGSNRDDLSDYRPGAVALRELGIRSPLQEAGLTKVQIRRLSRRKGLTTWDHPAMACLASRIPYGTALKMAVLKKIERAEELLRSLGYAQVRVRHHGQMARIEVGREDLERLLADRQKILPALKAIGYLYVAMDLEGYRMGSLNEALSKRKLRKKRVEERKG
jgi:uncharacterized protein